MTVPRHSDILAQLQQATREVEAALAQSGSRDQTVALDYAARKISAAAGSIGSMERASLNDQRSLAAQSLRDLDEAFSAVSRALGRGQQATAIASSRDLLFSATRALEQADYENRQALSRNPSTLPPLPEDPREAATLVADTALRLYREAQARPLPATRGQQEKASILVQNLQLLHQRALRLTGPAAEADPRAVVRAWITMAQALDEMCRLSRDFGLAPLAPELDQFREQVQAGGRQVQSWAASQAASQETGTVGKRQIPLPGHTPASPETPREEKSAQKSHARSG